MSPRQPERGYQVWAPAARHVTLVLNDRRHTMTSDGDGWWRSEIAAADGDLYGYVLDGEGPFPDPRSASQPFGVHGLSCAVDHARFSWSDRGWQAPPLASAVIYELHVGTFTEAGTFAGVCARLPELVDLGVTHLELMPVVEFPGSRGWGYDGVHLFAPHRAYGTPDDLKRLVDECHAHGLAVILDVVYNHLGPSGNYLGRFGPYFTARHKTPWGDAVNLDGSGSDEARRLFCDNALMWLRDYHFDGLRLDAVHALLDTSAIHFLEQLADEVRRLQAGLGRHLVVIAESDLNDPRLVASSEAGGFGLDAQWSDDFHHTLHVLLTGERTGYYEDFTSATLLCRALRSPFVFAGHYSPHRRRRHGRSAEHLPGWRFVVATQNHDQVGNRATGERLIHLTTVGRAKVAAALLLCAPFVPMLFQGEEWGASTPFQYFTAHEEPDLGRAVSEGRRKEFAAFGWAPERVPDPQNPDTFHRSQLRWHERAEPMHEEMLTWYRSLIALRRTRSSLTDGDTQAVVVDHVGEGRAFVIRRGEIAIGINLSAQPVTLPGFDDAVLLLTSQDTIALISGELRLPPDSVAILESPDTCAADVMS